MSQQTETVQVVVNLPATLGLTEEQVRTLEKKWQADLVAATTSPEAHAAKGKIHWSISLQIRIHN